MKIKTNFIVSFRLVQKELGKEKRSMKIKTDECDERHTARKEEEEAIAAAGTIFNTRVGTICILFVCYESVT